MTPVLDLIDKGGWVMMAIIALSVVLAFLIGAAFWMAVEGGQFDDLDGPALDVVADDDASPPRGP